MKTAPGVLVLVLAAGLAAGQPVPSSVHPLHRPFDELLDVYVRDGFVYYNALRIERGKLDRYVQALAGPAAEAMAAGTPDERKALWINAYNALVLKTVIDHYPIKGRAPEYPATSIRQIPGAFDRTAHRVAGRAITLDAIEKEMLAPLGDPRVFFALGRGAQDGGRLRSEAFDAPTMEEQLASVAAESARRTAIVQFDFDGNALAVSPIFSWREPLFVAALADRAPAAFAARSPIERAVIAFLTPHVRTDEALLLDRNTFSMRFDSFDWRLNDLGARDR